MRDSIALEERESTRRGTSVTAIKHAILDHLYYIQGRTRDLATRNDWYMVVAYTVRDRMLNRFDHLPQDLSRPEVKIASYLSAEFLMGPYLGNNLLCLGIADEVREAVNDSEIKRGSHTAGTSGSAVNHKKRGDHNLEQFKVDNSTCRG